MKSKKFVLFLILAILVSIANAEIQIWTQDWKLLDKCKPALLPWMPENIPERVSGLELFFLRQRQYGRSFPYWWKKMANVPDSGSYIHAVWEIEVVGNDIWMLRSGLVQRYDLENRKAINYQKTAEGHEIDWAHHVITLSNGEVWAIVRLEKSHAIAKYDEGLDSFQVVNLQGIPFLPYESKGAYSFDSNFVVTPDNELLIPINNNIYNISTTKETYELMLPDSFEYEIESIAVANDSVWFTDSRLFDLWQLNRHSGELVNHGGVISKNSYKAPVGIDGLGRIWVGYRSRLELGEDDQYYWWRLDSVPKEFLYLSNPHLDCLSGCADRILTVSEAYDIHIDSIGNVWFNSPSGLVEYDIYEDNWCLSLHKMPYSIIDDRNGNLWLALDKYTHNQGIYKYNMDLDDN